MPLYTVFCRSQWDLEAIHINTVEAESAEQAVRPGREACADDWDQETTDIDVIGVIPGSHPAALWNDEGLEDAQ